MGNALTLAGTLQGRDLIAMIRQDLREQLVGSAGAKLDVREGPSNIPGHTSCDCTVTGEPRPGKLKQVEWNCLLSETGANGRTLT